MIVQDSLPYDPFAPMRLPGIQPLDPKAWLLADDAYAGQMARRAEVLAAHHDEVVARCPGSEEAEAELLEVALAHLPQGFVQVGTTVTTPDGREVMLGKAPPLETLGALFQEDFCILGKPAGEAEHVLVAGLLCFPASWRLRQKIGRPLLAIHGPVPEYDEDVSKRVQRLFDGVQAGRPLWRRNAIWYPDPELYYPGFEYVQRPAVTPGVDAFLRSERQCILHLPRTNHVVFSIHTFIVPGYRVLPA